MSTASILRIRPGECRMYPRFRSIGRSTEPILGATHEGPVRDPSVSRAGPIRKQRKSVPGEKRRWIDPEAGRCERAMPMDRKTDFETTFADVSAGRGASGLLVWPRGSGRTGWSRQVVFGQGLVRLRIHTRALTGYSSNGKIGKVTKKGCGKRTSLAPARSVPPRAFSGDTGPFHRAWRDIAGCGPQADLRGAGGLLPCAADGGQQ
jgi:hypothetical protein